MTVSTQWQLARTAAERYEEILVPAILGPAAWALVDWAGLRPGETVLDVGCGTGAAARRAAAHVGKSGRVIGVDANAAMIAVAQALPPVAGAPIEWLEDNAERLPLPDRAVDVVLCAQTLQFVADRVRALEEMRRVLADGGRVALSLWCDLEQSPYFHALVSAVARHIDEQTAAGLGAAFRLTNADEIEALLRAAGFRRIELAQAQVDLDLPALVDFVPRHVSATPMIVGFAAAPQAAQQAVVRDVAAQLVAYATDGGVRIPFRSHLIRAQL